MSRPQSLERLQEIEAHQDASYGWGPRYRERGRFGSHPGYDGFGDEADP